MTRNELKAVVRERIGQFAFIPLTELRDNYSLDAMRPMFGRLSKLAMLTNLQEDGIWAMPNNGDILDALDTVDDFVDHIDLEGLMVHDGIAEPMHLVLAGESIKFISTPAPMPHQSSTVADDYDYDDYDDYDEDGDDDLATMLDEMESRELKPQPEEFEPPKPTGRILEL